MNYEALLEKCRTALAQIKQRSDCRLAVRLASQTLDLILQELPAMSQIPTRIIPPIQPSDLISLAEAAAIIPCKHRGKRVHVSTILRWGIAGRITLFQCNGWKVSETEIRSRFKPVPVRSGFATRRPQ